jgi:hypothetical protein
MKGTKLSSVALLQLPNDLYCYGSFLTARRNMLISRVRESHDVPPMRLNLISYCSFLPPREIAESFSVAGCE